MEEVGGHNALGLGGEELGPGGALTSGCRWETVPTQHHGDARLRHGDVEFLELADDPEVAPAGVLPSESADQLDGLVGKSRSSRSAVRVGPAPADHRTVPTEDGLRRDQERTPELARHETGEEGDNGTVGPGEAWTGDLAAKHNQLVAEHEDLGIFGDRVDPEDAERSEDASEEPVEEGERHGGRASPRAFPLVKLGRVVSGPFSSDSSTWRQAPGPST